MHDRKMRSGNDSAVPFHDLLNQLSEAKDQLQVHPVKRKSGTPHAQLPTSVQAGFGPISGKGDLFDPQNRLLQPRNLCPWDAARTMAPERAWPSRGSVGQLYDRGRQGLPDWKPASLKEGRKTCTGFLRPVQLGIWDQEKQLAPERTWPSFSLVSKLYDEKRQGQTDWKPQDNISRKFGEPMPFAWTVAGTGHSRSRPASAGACQSKRADGNAARGMNRPFSAPNSCSAGARGAGASKRR